MNTSITQTDQRAGPRSIWVFTPSRTEPKDLEEILVQRQELLKDAVERVRESALTGHKHHLLFVGPRGCGKTHLITLIVSRINADAEAAQQLRLAWLNEDETCTSLLEMLLKVHFALEKRYPGEFRATDLTNAYELTPVAALDFMTRRLLHGLGAKTLVIVTENLDALFESMGQEGQKQLRAFIQEHPQLAIVATAQRLVADLADRASPFFGFFQTEHLKPLSVDQATTLLQNIARIQGKTDVTTFLATSRGRSRVRAVHHLSKGNHRIYVVLSQFLTPRSIDTLIGPFLKMVDELTPYYQERVRWLPPLQRRIVELLCNCETTAPVKEIARRLFSTSQTISGQLQELREKGYVVSSQRGRESLYEISEPLMRICVEVKENQNTQPPRLLLEFLRVWYDDVELISLEGAPSNTAIDAHYHLGELYLSEGKWREGFVSIEAGLSLSMQQSPADVRTPLDIVNVLFDAGLSLEGRRTHAGVLYSLYSRHSATAVLGKALVKHLGRLFTDSQPWPASDNLDQWLAAWRHASGDAADFKLPLRLLRTGIEFIKAGGKDHGILLTLTSFERSLLHQALGLESSDPLKR